MLGAVVVLGGGAAAYVNIERSKKEKEAQCRRDQAVGRPDIGGPFKLTGLDGAYNVGRTLHEPPSQCLPAGKCLADWLHSRNLAVETLCFAFLCARAVLYFFTPFCVLFFFLQRQR